jgi:protein-disulfide isomerase
MLKNALFLLVLALIGAGSACDKKTTGGNKTTGSKTPVTTQTLNPNAPPGAQPPNMLGSSTASVAVEEFADFQCPTCANIHKVMKDVQAAYGSRIKFVYRHFPLTQIHKNAYDASVAAEAAGRQGKFWDMQNLIFTNQQAWSNAANARTLFEEYAQKLGLDVEQFKTDMAGMETKQRVDLDMQRGRALGVSSTPSIFINGISVPFEQMTLEGLRQVIDAELQKAQANQQSQTAPNNSSAPSNTATNAAKK